MISSAQLKVASLRAGVVLAPCYAAAFITDKMVWVVATLAAASFFAAGIGGADADERKVDEDGEDADVEGLAEAMSPHG
ncbi:MAG: hypothetical protein AAF676_17125 [Pseudomonadota bacterium]